MPDVSFIVPTRNNAATIEACLRSCREQAGATVEVIAVDNHSHDGTWEIAQRLADRALTAGPERSAQRNIGVSLATAPVVAIIDSDMVVQPDVARQLRERFARDEGLGAVVLPEYAVGSGMWGACRALEKRLYLGEAEVEAARGFRRTAFVEVGGYDESLTGPEDWDLPDRVLAAGWTLARTTAGVDHHDTVTSLRELFRKKRYYGRGVAAYHQKAGERARPMTRPSLLHRPALLAERPAITAALAGIKTVEAAGIVLGMVDHRLQLRTGPRPT